MRERLLELRRPPTIRCVTHQRQCPLSSCRAPEAALTVSIAMAAAQETERQAMVDSGMAARLCGAGNLARCRSLARLAAGDLASLEFRPADAAPGGRHLETGLP